MLQSTTRGPLLASILKSFHVVFLFFHWQSVLTKLKCSFILTNRHVEHVSVFLRKSRRTFWVLHRSLAKTWSSLDLPGASLPLQQVFSLLIVAIGVYAKIQKATGKTRRLFDHTHLCVCSAVGYSLQGPTFSALPLFAHVTPFVTSQRVPTRLLCYWRTQPGIHVASRCAEVQRNVS